MLLFWSVIRIRKILSTKIFVTFKFMNIDVSIYVKLFFILLRRSLNLVIYSMNIIALAEDITFHRRKKLTVSYILFIVVG